MLRLPSIRRRKNQKGSSLVELAICFLAFLLLTMGVFDFGMGVYAYNFCYFAAREATRWTSVHGSNSATASTCAAGAGIAAGCAANVSDVASHVADMAVALTSSGMAVQQSNTNCSSNNSLTVCTTWIPDTTPGSEVNITVSYVIVPVTGLGLKQNITVTSSSQMEMVH